jgi:glycosyltransferase involved in cell wall biosynthesis
LIDRPLVSVGVPVYNGEKWLSRAMDSIIAQDYSNLEIIISDNGSTDATSDVCEKYVRKDPRVKYSRSEKNLGAIWSFNRVFELSSGKYFMWSAHDDQRQSSYVSTCVEKMERCHDAVLCHAHTTVFIEGREEVLYVTSMDSFEGVSGVIERYRETIKHVPATSIYGLYRSSVLRKTHMFKKSLATDQAFLQELSVYGEFVQVPRKLFDYFGRKKWNTVHQDFWVYFGRKTKPWWYLPFIFLFCDHWTRVAHASVPFAVKLRLWGILIGHGIGQSALKIFIKTTGTLCPKRWKEKIGCAIYWRWMHNPNMKVSCEGLFLERVIKPTLGWWV